MMKFIYHLTMLRSRKMIQNKYGEVHPHHREVLYRRRLSGARTVKEDCLTRVGQFFRTRVSNL